MPLNRREAVTSLLAMLAMVMGLGALPEETVAIEPTYDPGDFDYDIHAVMIGHDKARSPWLEMGVNLHLDNGVVAISSASTRDEPPPYVVIAEHPEARRVIDQIVMAMLATGYEVPVAKKKVAPAQPHPGSGRSWWCQMHFAADEHHLPIPRNPELESQLTFDGHTLRLDVVLPPDPVWIGDEEQPNTPLGSFIFTGDPAAFLDAISAEGDRVWLKKQMEWAERPYTYCPECLADGLNKDRTGPCPNCNGRKWIYFTPEEGQRMVKKKAAKRQRRINRAVKRAAANQ